MTRTSGGYVVMHTDDVQNHYGINSSSQGWAVIYANPDGGHFPGNMRTVEVLRRKSSATDRAEELAKRNNRAAAVCFDKGDGQPSLIYADAGEIAQKLEEGQL